MRHRREPEPPGWKHRRPHRSRRQSPRPSRRPSEPHRRRPTGHPAEPEPPPPPPKPVVHKPAVKPPRRGHPRRQPAARETPPPIAAPRVSPPQPAPAQIAVAPTRPPMPAPAPRRPRRVSAGYRALLSAWLESHKRYPDSARARGEEGRAVLRFRVDRSGRRAELRAGPEHRLPDLDAAIDAMMRGATLPPFPADMTASDVEVSVTVRFSLTR